MQEQIFSVLTAKDSLSWKTIIFDIISKHNMDPWDIDLSLLSNKYIETLRQMKQMDFFISGKVLIAAAFLLRLKSVKLVDQDLAEFDRLIAESQRGDEDFLGEFYGELEQEWGGQLVSAPEVREGGELPIRTPQPRKRKVSVYDLVEALQRALEVHERKVLREMKAPKVNVPQKTRDITEILKEIYQKIKDFFRLNKGKQLTFSQLVPSTNKNDIIQTFVPLLHLSHIEEHKIELHQREHFGEILIRLPENA